MFIYRNKGKIISEIKLIEVKRETKCMFRSLVASWSKYLALEHSILGEK